MCVVCMYVEMCLSLLMVVEPNLVNIDQKMENTYCPIQSSTVQYTIILQNQKEKLVISTNFNDNNQVDKKSIMLKILCN